MIEPPIQTFDDLEDNKPNQQLLNKADALLHKYTPNPLEQDIPLLTDIIFEDSAQESRIHLDTTTEIEALLNLESKLAQQFEQWAQQELPKLVNEQLAQLSKQICQEALSNLQLTVFNQLSNSISSMIQDIQQKRESHHS